MVDKQPAGFKFGKNRTKVIRLCGGLVHNGRPYKLFFVEADGSFYYSLRLYNAKGKFIKQFMFEPEAFHPILAMMFREWASLIGLMLMEAAQKIRDATQKAAEKAREA